MTGDDGAWQDMQLLKLPLVTALCERKEQIASGGILVKFVSVAFEKSSVIGWIIFCFFVTAGSSIGTK
jgi:hypothetical protein